MYILLHKKIEFGNFETLEQAEKHLRELGFEQDELSSKYWMHHEKEIAVQIEETRLQCSLEELDFLIRISPTRIKKEN